MFRTLLQPFVSHATRRLAALALAGSAVLSSAWVTGCATAPPAAPINPKHETIAAIQKLEVLYHDTKLIHVYDQGGSGWTQLAGLLGPLGNLIGVVIDGNSRIKADERGDERSKAFTDKLQASGVDINANLAFAEKLAAKLRTQGKEVKLTAIAMPTGPLGQMTWKAPAPTPGFAQLTLRTMLGYHAASATSSFESTAIVETALLDDHSTHLAHHTENTRDFSPSYYTYLGLLGEHTKAFEALKTGLLARVESQYSALFDQ